MRLNSKKNQVRALVVLVGALAVGDFGDAAAEMLIGGSPPSFGIELVPGDYGEGPQNPGTLQESSRDVNTI